MQRPHALTHLPTTISSHSVDWDRKVFHTSMVKMVLALLKMEVREDMRAAIITAIIKPRSPGRKGGGGGVWWLKRNVAFVDVQGDGLTWWQQLHDHLSVGDVCAAYWVSTDLFAHLRVCTRHLICTPHYNITTHDALQKAKCLCCQCGELFFQGLIQDLELKREHCAPHWAWWHHHKSTCVKDPADHARQHDGKERQNLQVDSQQGAAFRVRQGLSSQRSLHNHLQDYMSQVISQACWVNEYPGWSFLAQDINKGWRETLIKTTHLLFSPAVKLLLRLEQMIWNASEEQNMPKSQAGDFQTKTYRLSFEKIIN